MNCSAYLLAGYNLSALHEAKYGSMLNKNIKIRHPLESGDPSNWLIKMDSHFASFCYAKCLLKPLRGNDEIVSYRVKISSCKGLYLLLNNEFIS